MSFLRHKEIFRSGGGSWSGAAPATGAHRLDESPAGYSSAGCSPAAPASASPADCSMQHGRPKRYDLAGNGSVSLFALSQRRGASPVHSSPLFWDGCYFFAFFSEFYW